MGHFSLPLPGLFCGRGGMADAPDLGSGVERRKSSSLFVRTVSRFPRYAVVAQLVECHLAKVDVAGPSPVYRSICGCSSMVELQPSKLVTWVRFPSPALTEARQMSCFFCKLRSPLPKPLCAFDGCSMGGTIRAEARVPPQWSQEKHLKSFKM